VENTPSFNGKTLFCHEYLLRTQKDLVFNFEKNSANVPMRQQSKNTEALFCTILILWNETTSKWNEKEC
jgi:hypothetical protein